MTEEELYKKGQKLYHSRGKENKAIEVYKELINLYPNNIDGWRDISAMYYSIGDFDNAIPSSRKVLSLSNSETYDIENHLTRLTLISRYSFSEPNMYLDEQKKVAYQINTITSFKDLFLEIEKCNLSLIQIFNNDNKKLNKIFNSFANTCIRFKYYEKAINALNKVIELQDYGRVKIHTVYNRLSLAFVGLKKYDLALENIDIALNNGLEDFKLISKAEIYKQKGDLKKFEKTLTDLLSKIQIKLMEKPEPAYIFQKISVLKKLEDKEKLAVVIKDFDLIKNNNEYTKAKKLEAEKDIKNYLQHGV